MLQLEGMCTAKIVLFHQGNTELRRCENYVFFLPVNILTGVTRRLLGPHDIPCVLILICAKFNNDGTSYCHYLKKAKLILAINDLFQKRTAKNPENVKIIIKVLPKSPENVKKIIINQKRCYQKVQKMKQKGN